MRTIRITFRRMIVCVCHRVSDRDIARAAREGCASFDELQQDTAVATACGACHDCARDTFHHHAAQAGAASALAVAASRCGTSRVHIVPRRETAVAAGA